MNWRIDINKDAMGGTEQIMEKIYNSVDSELLSKFQIIPSRVRELDDTKVRILFLHDLPGDPESKHLENGGWAKFHKLVFVSNWQKQQYIDYYNIPWSMCTVMLNAIDPIDVKIENKPTDKINIVYHTTPHRGLELLVPVFENLAENNPDIHLHVFSSFKIYGWEQRDKPYEKLFEKINSSDRMTYYGYVPNKELREHLKDMHIFGYPSIWPETSCISLMEAMSAGILCVHPNYGALFETGSNWTAIYDWHENVNEHAGIFHSVLTGAIDAVRVKSPGLQLKLEAQKSHADLHYNWEVRKQHWTNLLNSLKDMPTEIKENELIFTYKTL